jgi:hypothetical protein
MALPEDESDVIYEKSSSKSSSTDSQQVSPYDYSETERKHLGLGFDLDSLQQDALSTSSYTSVKVTDSENNTPKSPPFLPSQAPRPRLLPPPPLPPLSFRLNQSNAEAHCIGVVSPPAHVDQGSNSSSRTNVNLGISLDLREDLSQPLQSDPGYCRLQDNPQSPSVKSPAKDGKVHSTGTELNLSRLNLKYSSDF